MKSAIVLAAACAALMLPAPALAQPATPTGPVVRGLITTWYAFDQTSPDALVIRRANIWVLGDVTPQLSYTIMVNPAKTLSLPTVTTNGNSLSVSNTGDGKVLQDAFLTATVLDAWKVTMGQFRPPLSREAITPGANLPLAKRALYLEGNSFGFCRDTGLQVAGPVLPGLTVTGGVFSGQTTNQVETNDQKDLLGRLDWVPFKDVSLGAVYLRGTRGATSSPTERMGANAALNLGAFQLSGELLAGTDGTTPRMGWYGQMAYRFRPELQGVLRHERWDADQKAAGFQQDTTLGLNYDLTGSSKVALNLIHEDFSGSSARTNEQALLLWQLML